MYILVIGVCWMSEAYCISVSACIFALHLHVYIRCHDRGLYLYCWLCLAVVSRLVNWTVMYSGCIHAATQGSAGSWVYSQCYDCLWLYSFCVIVVGVLCLECIFSFFVSSSFFFLFVFIVSMLSPQDLTLIECVCWLSHIWNSFDCCEAYESNFWHYERSSLFFALFYLSQKQLINLFYQRLL